MLKDERSIRILINKFGLLILLVLVLFACSSKTPEVPKLRIANNGAYPIKNLTVRFPDSEINFGDIEIGETTDYLEAPNGVLQSAAYFFEIDGEIKSQFVIDFLGEEPLNGVLFTYVVDFDYGRFPKNETVRLLEVKLDK